VKLHVEPTYVLVPTRINDEALAYLEPEDSLMLLGNNEGMSLTAAVMDAANDYRIDKCSQC
jgi:hypothetical protein